MTLSFFLFLVKSKNGLCGFHVYQNTHWDLGSDKIGLWAFWVYKISASVDLTSWNLMVHLPPVQKYHVRPIKLSLVHLCHISISLKKRGYRGVKNSGNQPTHSNPPTHKGNGRAVPAYLQVDSGIWVWRTDNIHPPAYPLYIYTHQNDALLTR